MSSSAASRRACAATGRPRAAPATCSRASASGPNPISPSTSCPMAICGASRSPARWRRARSCCCSTSLSPGSAPARSNRSPPSSASSTTARASPSSSSSIACASSCSWSAASSPWISARSSPSGGRRRSCAILAWSRPISAGRRPPVALLEVKNLVVHYGKALALDGVNLRVEAGELVGVLGPNGAGKSTLLKAISRAVPSRGDIVFNGKPLGGMPAHEVVAEGICHCPEGRRLFPELTVLKNLQLGAYLRRDKDGIAADLERVYALFPVLRQRGRQQASTLSGGEQRSEEHTSELQSRLHLVCRLLLEKKNHIPIALKEISIPPVFLTTSPICFST